MASWILENALYRDYRQLDIEGVLLRGQLVWNFNLLAWERMQQPIIEAGSINVGAVDQGTPAAQASRWPVFLSDGSASVGTLANPLRTDPTGSTPQPVSAATLPLPSGAATEATLTRATPANTSALSTRVALTDVAVALPASALADRKRVLAKNTGDNTAFIGGSGVTANGSSTDGIDLDPGQTLDAMIGASAVLYGRCATGLTTVLKILEFA